MLEDKTFPAMKKVGYIITHKMDKSAHIVVLDDEHPLYDKYGTGSIPCFLIVKNGKVVEKFSGYIDAINLSNKIIKVTNEVQ